MCRFSSERDDSDGLLEEMYRGKDDVGWDSAGFDDYTSA